MGKETRSVLWHRLDQPGYESARLASEGKNWRLAGTAVFRTDRWPCRLDYSILCDSQWHTIAARVEGWVGEEQIAIVISVDKAHHWWMNSQGAAIKNIKAVAGCLDLDLNFSPVTNTLPIRRLGLKIGQAADVKAAWLRFPEFTLEPLEQRYSRIDAATYRYESGDKNHRGGGRFVRDLQVDDSGFITEYPGIWQLEAITGSF